MASSSSRLTKYVNATTIVTADIANAWFGGLYGSSEGAALDSTDPRNTGHVHDGQHLDGHSSKVDLFAHVTGELRNVNLADEAVTIRNIQNFASAGDAIPEYTMVDGQEYYYLDLSAIRDEIGAATGGVFEYDITTDTIRVNNAFGPDYGTTNFLFGSPTLAYDADTDHANRMAFLKSEGAFRAGTETSTGFDAANVGDNSFAIGSNTIASGLRSFAFGRECEATGDYSMAVGAYAVATDFGQVARSSGKFSVKGDAQRSTYDLRTEFTIGGSATDLVLKLWDGSRIELENNSTYFFQLKSLIICATTNEEEIQIYDFAVRRGASAAAITTTLSGQADTVFASTYSGATLQITPGVSAGELVILMAGGTNGHSFKWIAQLDALKITY